MQYFIGKPMFSKHRYERVKLLVRNFEHCSIAQKKKLNG